MKHVAGVVPALRALVIEMLGASWRLLRMPTLHVASIAIPAGTHIRNRNSRRKKPATYPTARLTGLSPTSHLCLSNVDYANAVTPWLRTHPEATSLSVEGGIFLALNKLYKCGPPNNY